MARDWKKSWIEDEDFFREQLTMGKSMESLVAQKLTDAGIPDVHHEDMGFRKDLSEIKFYSEETHDLWIKKWPFEVKSREVEFTEPDDWPMNLWPMMVDTVQSFSEKKIKPVGYIFISQITFKMMAVSLKSFRHWTTILRYDHKRGIKQEYYAVKKNHVISEADLIQRLRDMEWKRD